MREWSERLPARLKASHSPRNGVSMPPSEAHLSYVYLPDVQKRPLETPIPHDRP